MIRGSKIIRDVDALESDRLKFLPRYRDHASHYPFADPLRRHECVPVVDRGRSVADAVRTWGDLFALDRLQF